MKRARYLALSGPGNFCHVRAAELTASTGLSPAVIHPNFLLFSDQPVAIVTRPPRTAVLLGGSIAEMAQIGQSISSIL